MKAIIVAYDKNRTIGINGELPWGRSLPTDLMHFKSLTFGQTVIMGRKTFESIGRSLPERQNIVLTKQAGLELPGALVVNDISDAYAAAEGKIFVIGGGEIYQQALPDADIIYATEVQASFEGGDAHFPELGDEWREISRYHHEADEKNLYPFDFVTFTKN